MATYNLPVGLRKEIISAEDRPCASIPKRQLERVEKQRQRFIRIHNHDGFPADAESVVGVGHADIRPTRNFCLV